MEEIVNINTDQLLIKRQVFYKFHILVKKGWKGTVVNQACTPLGWKGTVVNQTCTPLGWKGTVVNQACTPLLIKSHLKAHRESV